MSFPQEEFDSWLDETLEYEWKNALAWRTHDYRGFIRSALDIFSSDLDPSTTDPLTLDELESAKWAMAAKLALVQERVGRLVCGQKIGLVEFERIWKAETEKVIEEFREDYQR
jgi:hypothetical protein